MEPKMATMNFIITERCRIMIINFHPCSLSGFVEYDKGICLFWKYKYIWCSKPGKKGWNYFCLIELSHVLDYNRLISSQTHYFTTVTCLKNWLPLFPHNSPNTDTNSTGDSSQWQKSVQIIGRSLSKYMNIE